MTARLYTIASILAVSLLLGAADPGPPVAGPTARLAWDHSGLAADGSAEEVVEFDLEVLDAAGTQTLASRSIPACEAAGPMTCEEAVGVFGLPQGTYTFRVRAVDGAGNASGWCDPVLVTLDLVPPARPSGCRILR